MANAEQLEILKQGVEAWNDRREKNDSIDFDLRRANLTGADLRGANLWLANLFEAELSRSDLSEADLSDADLSGANLSGATLTAAILHKTKFSGANLLEANLFRAELWFADLSRAILCRADLSGTNLKGANFSKSDLSGANLRGAELNEAHLNRANLMGCSFLNTEIGDTIFVNLDLSEAIGLESVHHRGPSRISTDTFALSMGKIPEVFLRGCGLSDWEIASVKLYDPNLSNDEINKILYRMYDLRATQALQISPLFVSYSHADSEFVDKIGDSMTEKGIRYWRDIHDMKSGRMEKQIDQAIRQNPTVLLILSEHSLSSDWVEHEVRTTRELEKEIGRDVLCPVALDDGWKSSRWPKRIMEQVMEYNILDFSAWEDDGKFVTTFNKLIDGLGLFYKG